MTRLAIGVLLLTPLLPQLALAERIAPINVDPIIYEGICYVAANDDTRRGYIEAWNVETNKKLWELTIFINRIDRNLVEDAQWMAGSSLHPKVERPIRSM